jgi:hydrogenase/urease accessory protein HupE
MARRGFALAAGMAALALAPVAEGHPMPFSSLDLRLFPDRIEATLTVHAYDLAQTLGEAPPERLLDPDQARARGPAIIALLQPRLDVQADGRTLAPRWSRPEVVRERQGLRLPVAYHLAEPPGLVTVQAALFPHDSNHQTFVNVYEGERLVTQAIVDRTHPAFQHVTGLGAGWFSVVRRFVAAGVHHILIGFDHVLFLVGLLLLGGSLRQLVTVVSAFTIGHSITLSLAALGIASPPARLIEPAIALSIVLVGADNLMARQGSRDLRAWIALAFGLVHGFGFAGVLRESGLPSHGLHWALFSFNLGVEIGQLLVVVIVSFALAALRSRSERAGRQLAMAGSVVVAAAGAFWFIERLFFSGGTS